MISSLYCSQTSSAMRGAMFQKWLKKRVPVYRLRKARKEDEWTMDSIKKNLSMSMSTFYIPADGTCGLWLRRKRGKGHDWCIPQSDSASLHLIGRGQNPNVLHFSFSWVKKHDLRFVQESGLENQKFTALPESDFRGRTRQSWRNQDYHFSSSRHSIWFRGWMISHTTWRELGLRPPNPNSPLWPHIHISKVSI